MKFSTLTGSFALIFSALVSADYGNSPAPVPAPYNGPVSVKTVQTCATQYCAVNSVAHVPTSTYTVHTAVTTKVTKTDSKPNTAYVTLKDQTKTLTKTQIKSCTYTAKGTLNTVYTTKTVKVTSTYKATTVKTAYTTLPAKTIKPYGNTVPTPGGFVYVANDAANSPANYPAAYGKRSDYGSAPVPAPKPAGYNGGETGGKPTSPSKGHYPTLVKCTKVYQTITPQTYTVAAKPVTTLTVYGNTATVVYTSSVTKTIYPGKLTTTYTRVATAVVKYTSTKTAYTTITKQATVTAKPVTTYAACNAANVYKGPSGSVNGAVGSGSDSKVIPNITSPEACCVSCQTHKNASGACDCVGSFYSVKGGVKTCTIKVSNTCSAGKNILNFSPYSNANTVQGYVSNGPCGRWHVKSTPSAPAGYY
ncbi:hypothetical protein ABW20_dc0107634 [Dactylellina cionopaga]|nr:hypothetical protein ABW20_dc0107634 [Dactylellina cionopaga]